MAAVVPAVDEGPDGGHQLGDAVEAAAADGLSGWGLLLALSSVFVAPWVQRRIGTFGGIVTALTGFALALVVMALFADNKAVLASCVVIAGAFLGVNNT